jgi:cbb3-type cytochrome c oxidase subunit III
MRYGIPLLITFIVAGGVATAQTPANGDAARGAALFQLRCSDCHGVDAKGVHGPDLTVLFANGATDGRVFQTIRQGVPGTEMPSTNAPDDEIRAIVAYLRAFVASPAPAVRGDAANGQRIFSASCARCHRAEGQGGALGPDLSRISASFA